MHRLIYCSKAAGLSQADVEAILSASALNNSRVGVTGMLLFNAGYFLQMLEGDRGEVTRTFCRIAQDHRHQDIELLSATAAPARLFSEWDMRYVSLKGVVGDLLKTYQSQGNFDPYDMSDRAAEDFCQACAGLQNAAA